MDASLLPARDLRVLWHPCTQMQDHEQRPPVAIRRGSGSWLEDFDGHRYLDGISSWWVNLFGHANPRINAAIKTQLDTLEHVLLAGFTHEPVITLSERLIRIAPRGLTRCFYAESGSAAIEIALKMSLHYWRNEGEPARTRFVSLRNAYHGETIGALALGDVGLYRSPYEPMLPSWPKAESPAGNGAPEIGPRMERALADLERILSSHTGSLCAVAVEPLIQCAGGMRMYPAEYLSRVRALCSQYRVHLIADEIAVGFGRTGTLFACEQAGIAPDFLCIGKGLTGGYLPLSACLTTDTVYGAFYGGGSERAFLHSHSYNGNPLACAAAIATLSIFEEDDVLAQNRVLSAHLARRMQDLAAHPHVRNVRQTGLVAALDLVGDRESGTPYPLSERRGRRACDHALTRGALLRPLGDVLYIMPPYIITPEEIDQLVDALYEGIDYATAG
ncbi:MAG: adenosylmethionine--8-amino-7-oxononanoate transaminase [Acidiferrobacteraceae bacterium]